MPEEQIVRMTLAGWVFLAASWTAITALIAFCIARVLRSGKKAGSDETPLG